jgi:peptidoglycan/LPS O-acetylase OafA/YrhL
MLSFGPRAVRSAKALLTPGWTGVDLFFVLSGCLITGILLDEKGTANYFRRFYIRRALRIFPVYYLALAICLATIPGPIEISRGTLAAYLLNASNWLSLSGTEIKYLSHYWSLAVEEQFYLLWPLAIFLLSRRAILRVVVALLILAPLVRYVILVSMSNYDVALRVAETLTPARADGLAFGALVAICLRNDRLRSAILNRSGLILSVAGGALVVWFGVRERLHLETPLARCLLSTLIGLCYGLVALRVASGTGSATWLPRVLRWSILRAAGRYSYAAYVFHLLPIFWVIEAKLGSLPASTRSMLALPCFLGCIALVFLIARLSWWLIEAPLLRQKDKLAPSPRRQAAAAPHGPLVPVTETP